MRTRIHVLLLVLSLGLTGWALFGNLAGCSNEKKHVNPPIVGPAAGSGPTGGGETQRIELLASPSETLTTVGDEQGVINVTALIENNIGQPMPDGTPVYWSTTDGALDSMSTTSSNGSTSTTLTFPVGYDGCSIVTARSGDATTSIRLCVRNVQATPTPSETFIVQTNDNDLNIGDVATIIATAKTNGNADEGIQVNFTVNNTSAILSASAATTDSNGEASIELTNNNATGSDQTVTVTATAADGRTGTVQIILRD